jgi:hypothetical protein
MPDSPLPFSIEDLVDMHHPSDAQLSPDGKVIAFVLGETRKLDKDHPPQKTIYFIDVKSREMRLFTGRDTGTNNRTASIRKKLNFT